MIAQIVRAGTRIRVDIPKEGDLMVSFTGTCKGVVNGLPQYCPNPKHAGMGYPGDELDFWVSDLEINDIFFCEDGSHWRVTAVEYWPGTSAGLHGPDEYSLKAERL